MKALLRPLLRLLPDVWALQLLNLYKLGRLADLNSPRTINEKVNWRKLHQRDPRFTLFADKQAVKAEMARLIGGERVIPTLWSGENPDELPFDKLTPPYVVKTNHGYGRHLFIRRTEDLDADAARATLRRGLAHSHGRAGREWGYYGIPPRILVEPLLPISEAGAPEDYKFFVYHGRVHFVQLDFSRRDGHLRAFYDRDWNKLPVATKVPDRAAPFAAPACLEEMLGVAETVGRLFDFVRVDLYLIRGKVFFGEATFYPSGGYSRKYPEIWDLKFGEPWILPGA